MRQVYFLDTTLRDGIKIGGIYLSSEEKIQVARQLVSLGVNVLEVGFPAASEDQYRSGMAILEAVKGPVFSVLARATNPKDFNVAADVLKLTPNSRVHTFLPISSVYRDHFIKKPFEKTLEMAQEAVRLGKDTAREVEFSLIDAFRADSDEILSMTEKVVSSGVDIVNYADTVGCATPWMVKELIEQLRKRFGQDLKLSIHCHNDLGLATANSLEALAAGAQQVHCTVNGLGERAGNTPLEELAVVIWLYGNKLGLKSSINIEKLYSISRIVQHYTGVATSTLKPLVGQNAFMCDISTPQLGDVTEQPPFYVITPKDIGVPKYEEPLDKETSLDQFKERLSVLGYDLSENIYRKAYEIFLETASKKDYLFSRDVELIARQAIYQVPQKYKLLYLNVSAGSIPVPHATVQLELDGQIVQDAGFGHGPVDATFKTIFRMVKRFPKLIKYEVNAATTGTDAQGQVLLRLQEDSTVVDGRAVNTDIVLASGLALIDALNKLEFHKGKNEISELTDDESWTVIL